MLPTKFRIIWQSGFKGDFLEIDQSESRIACGGHVSIHLQTWPPQAILVSDW
jgi:hypothetical protein